MFTLNLNKVTEAGIQHLKDPAYVVNNKKAIIY